MHVSFLLSTIRPGGAKRVIDQINSVKTDLSYEILVYGPTSFEELNTRCFVGDLNSIFGYNYLYKQSIGEAIIGLVDDYVFNGNWPDIYYELQEERDKKFQMVGALLWK